MSEVSTVNEATKADVPTLVSFTLQMGMDAGEHLNAGVVEQAVIATINDPARGFYLVARMCGESVGFVFVVPEWSDWHNGWYWWVVSVRVVSEYRHRGVASALLFEVERRAQERGVIDLRGYVNDSNDPAKTLYVRLGAFNSGYWMYEKPVSR